MIIKNWKTTLTGVLGAIFYAVFPLIQGGSPAAKDLVLAAVIAGISAAAKDFDTTGTGATATKKR